MLRTCARAYAVGMVMHHGDFDLLYIWVWHSPLALKAFVGVSAVGGVKKWWTERRRRLLLEESRHWPEVEATVVTAQLVSASSSHRRNEAQVYIGVLSYGYMGDEIEVGDYRHHFEREDEADAWVRAMRTTKKIRVRVDPQNKTRSIWIETEADHALQAAAAEVKADDAAAPHLTGWPELLRVATLLVAASGGLLAVYVHLSVLAGAMLGRAVGPSQNFALIGGLYLAMIVCATTAGYVMHRRYPQRGKASALHVDDDASRRQLLWLGCYSMVAFLVILVRLLMHPNSAGDPVLSALTAVWLPAYAGTVVACLQAGADEELGAGLVRR
jgi:hypothetical protein